MFSNNLQLSKLKKNSCNQGGNFLKLNLVQKNNRLKTIKLLQNQMLILLK